MEKFDKDTEMKQNELNALKAAKASDLAHLQELAKLVRKQSGTRLLSDASWGQAWRDVWKAVDSLQVRVMTTGTQRPPFLKQDFL